MNIEIVGIKCDNTNCDYRDETVKREDYPDWLNKPCPKCGSNLLTQADLDSVIKMEETVDILNSVFGTTKDVDKDDSIQLTLDMDGSGKIGFE